MGNQSLYYNRDFDYQAEVLLENCLGWGDWVEHMNKCSYVLLMIVLLKGGFEGEFNRGLLVFWEIIENDY
jgi:hypothetical protein